jgi:hypothetical protein
MEVGAMNFLKKWPLILVSFFFISTAFGHSDSGFWIEPYLGYGFQVSGKEDPEESGNATKYNGLDIGARVGFRLGKFMLGIDGDYMTGSVTSDVDGRNDLNKYNFGAYAGLKFGDWIVRATWYWSTTWKFRDGSRSGDEYKGDGWGVGAAWKLT